MRRRRVYGRTFQRGFGIVSALLALLVGSFVTMGVIQGKLTENQLNTGALQGDLLKQIAEAANSYALENYAELQNGGVISRNGVTLAGGVALGQTLSPHVSDLVALGYLPPGTKRMATAVDGAFYKIAFRREPAGCVGSACEIPGLVYIDRPIAGSAADEMKGVVVGALMRKLGADAMVAFNSAPANLVAIGGASTPNPVAGAPAGVVGAKVGFGAIGFGRYLVVGDPRDPNFQGNVTVAKALSAESVRAGVVGTPWISSSISESGGCSRVENLSWGEIRLHDPICNPRIFVDSNDNRMTFLNNGFSRLQIDGDRKLIVVGNDANAVYVDGRDGTVTSEWVKAKSGVWTKHVQIDDSTGVRSVDVSENGLLAHGAGGIDVLASRTWGNYLRAQAYAAPGSPCNGRDAYDIASNSTGPGLVVCYGSFWVAMSMPDGYVDGACAPNAALGKDPDGAALICSGGRWVSLVDRFGKHVFAESYSASNGQSVPKPPCLSGTTGSLIYLVPRGEETAVRFVNRKATDMGGSWAISIQDGNDVAIPGDVLALTYCAY